MKKLLAFLFLLLAPLAAQGQTTTTLYRVDTIAALKAIPTSRPPVVIVMDIATGGEFAWGTTPCSAADDVYQVTPTAGPTGCWTRLANTQAIGLAPNISRGLVTATGSTTARTLAARTAAAADVRDFGAVGDGVADDTAALNTAFTYATTNAVPFVLGKGTFKVTSKLTWDFTPVFENGLTIISDNAVIDGTAIGGSGNVMQWLCSGGTTPSPQSCYRTRLQGGLRVTGSTTGYVVDIGKTDFSDALNVFNINQLSVQNFNTGAGGGIRLNYILGTEMHLVSSCAGNGAALAFQQVAFSYIYTNATCDGTTGGRSILIENGITKANMFASTDMEISAVLLEITSSGAIDNTFISPNFSGNSSGVGVIPNVGVKATAGSNNVLINPNYNGYPGTLSYTDGNTVGIRVLGGSGTKATYVAPAVTTYTVTGLDDGTIMSSGNAGATLAITLPATVLQPGWTMTFVSEGGNAITLTPAGGKFILFDGQTLASVTVPGGSGAAEVRLVSRGDQWQLDYASPAVSIARSFAGASTFTDTVTFPTPFTLGATSVTTTGTNLNYLTSATGTTGTTSTNIVFSTSPTLVTPILGVASATSVNKVAITAPATSATLTVADGKTLTASNTLTLTATDGSTLAIGAGGTLGTAAYKNTGTSGANIGFLNGNWVQSGAVQFSTGISVGAPTSGVQSNVVNSQAGYNVMGVSAIDGSRNASLGTVTAVLASTAQTNTVCYNSGTGLFTYQTWATGCLASSARFKENISAKSNADALKVVTSLEPVTFNYKKSADMGSDKHNGFIAEQVVKVAPDLVVFEKDGKTPRAVKYQEMAPYFAGAIRELKAANDNLKAEIAELKKKVK